MSSARVNRFISSLRATAIEAFSEFPKGEGMADYRDAVGYLHQDVFNLQQFAELARRSESAISKRIEREFPIVYRTKNALGPSATWLSYGVSTRGVNHAAVAANSRVFRQDPNEIVSNYDDPKIRESIRELLISTEQKREQMVQMIFSTFGGNSKITTRLLKPEVRFGVEVWVPSVELNGKFETVEALRSFFVRRLKVAQVSDELLKLIFEYSKQARAFERPNDFNQDEMTVLNTSESDLGISKQRRSQDDAALSKMDFIFDGESVGAKKTHECEAQLAALTQQSSNVDPDWIIDHLSHGDVIQRMRARQKETRRLVEKHFQNRILPRSAKDAEDHTGDESAIHLAEVPEWQDISTFFAEFEPGDRFMAVSNITLDGRSIVPLEERSDLREVAETISKMAKAEVLDRGISQIDPDGGAEIQIGVEVLPVRIERGGVKYDVNIYWKSFGRMTSEQRDELEALSSPQFLRSALNSRMDQRWADGLQGVNMIIVN